MPAVELEPSKVVTGPSGKSILSGWRHKEQKNKRAVLFVHGFIGDPASTWSTHSSVKFLDLLANDEELADYDVFSFGYQTNILNGSRIENVARQLSDEIHGSLKDYNLVLIAHSLGGLVCMSYVLQRLEHHNPLPILGLLLYGTPTTGTDLIGIAKTLGFVLEFTPIGPVARIIKFFAKRHRQLEQLASGNAFLQDLHDKWSLRVVNGGHSSLRQDERTWLPVRVVTGEGDYVVSESSAKSFYGEVDWHPLAFSHTALVKPESRDDVRYQRARDFLKVCRREKDSRVLGEIWKISQAVWNSRKGKLIKNWEYVVNIHKQGDNPLDPILRESGFSPCSVHCSYTTVLEQPDIRIGVSLGQIAGNDFWSKMQTPGAELSHPAYVHGLYVDTLPEVERRKVGGELLRILDGKDLERSWKMLYQTISVMLSTDNDATDIQLSEGKIVRGNSALLRSYPLPLTPSLRGEEVTIKISYESIVPQGLPSFQVRFPWLTEACAIQIIVHGDMEYFVWTSHLVGEPTKEVASEDQGLLRKFMLKSNDIFLPGSRLDVRWQLRARAPEPKQIETSSPPEPN